MFEKEIAQLHHIIQKNTIGNADSVALKHIVESNIPTNVKSFFKAEVEWLLFTERKKEQRSTLFDYQHEDIQLLQEQMDMLLMYHYTFSKKAFFLSLDRCIHFLFNFLCRPQWTLENFLFEEKDTINADELKVKFKFCFDYRYYGLIADQYLQSKKMTELSKENAIALFDKIDNEIIKNHSATELAKMTETFFDFVSYIHQHGEQNIERGVPTKATVYFFEDKHLSSVAQHLLKLRDFGKSRIEYTELVQELKDSYVKKGFSVEKEFSYLNQKETRNSNNVSLQVPESEKKLIIKSIFGGEESRFRSIIGNILLSASWDDASLALDHYFTMNDIDPFSHEAITLTNSLQSHFSNQQSKDEQL